MKEIVSLTERARKYLNSSRILGVISAFGEYFVKTGIFPRDMGRELNRAFEKRWIFIVVNDDGETYRLRSKYGILSIEPEDVDSTVFNSEEGGGRYRVPEPCRTEHSAGFGDPDYRKCR